VKRLELPDALRTAALDCRPVSGLTHLLYRYPARFSPGFASASIESYSSRGDVVLDPFVGGGTTVIEAMRLGRRAVGADINQLALFITRAKVARPSPYELRLLRHWADEQVTRLRYTDPLTSRMAKGQTANLDTPQFRPLLKLIALSLESVERIGTSDRARLLAKSAVLSTCQQFLHGTRKSRSAGEYRDRLLQVAHDTIDAVEVSMPVMAGAYPPLLVACDAEFLGCSGAFRIPPVDLMVTSPPYPGIHALYHRWQIDGRRESNAPYWIAGCEDGSGASVYTFADRKASADDRYFAKASKVFSNIRSLMRSGGTMVQLMSFASPGSQLPRYLRTMERAGFREIRAKGAHRLWREVPGRRWQARIHGALASSREVVLIHRAC